jgi:hypothetical protein
MGSNAPSRSMPRNGAGKPRCRQGDSHRTFLALVSTHSQAQWSLQRGPRRQTRPQRNTSHIINPGCLLLPAVAPSGRGAAKQDEKAPGAPAPFPFLARLSQPPSTSRRKSSSPEEWGPQAPSVDEMHFLRTRRAPSIGRSRCSNGQAARRASIRAFTSRSSCGNR